MIQKRKIFFDSSFSNAQFEVLNFKKKLYLKKKIINPKKRDFDSIEKNNFFLKNIRIKNLRINKIDIESLKILKKQRYFLMNYIDGYSGDLILKNIGIKETKILREFLINYFIKIKKFTKWKKIEGEFFIKKINDVKKNINQKELLVLFNDHEKHLFEKLDKIKYYPTGICHGDLTLSNMIIKNNKIYLIDFLKTYNDSILQDLSKIYQEFILGWSSRFLSRSNIIRSKIIYENIINKNYFNSLPKNILISLDFEIILTLLRIFPYVKRNDLKTIKWLKESLIKIKKLNNKF